jgi:hypothetical protein
MFTSNDPGPDAQGMCLWFRSAGYFGTGTYFSLSVPARHCFFTSLISRSNPSVLAPLCRPCRCAIRCVLSDDHPPMRRRQRKHASQKSCHIIGHQHNAECALHVWNMFFGTSPDDQMTAQQFHDLQGPLAAAASVSS